jgi:DNA recombination protein RmuC
MDSVLILLLAIIFLVLAALLFSFFYLLRKVGELTSALGSEEILQRLELHKGELGSSLKSLDSRLHKVTSEIGGVKEVTTQLQEFQASLKSQKLRGNVGEMVLEDLLHQILPSTRYRYQHTFKNGKRVDALIKTRQGLIPVDSKFPVENFQAFASAGGSERSRFWKVFVRDVKKRMDETAGYILPEEGTVPFALMYIPFEPIYQEVASDRELTRYTLEKRVFFVSPQTFYVTIYTILLGFQREKFAEEAEEILKTLHAVIKDASQLDELLNRTSTQLDNAKSNLDQLVGSFSGFLGKLEKLDGIRAASKT